MLHILITSHRYDSGQLEIVIVNGLSSGDKAYVGAMWGEMYSPGANERTFIEILGSDTRRLTCQHLASRIHTMLINGF